jgi:site-specific DNA-methyltransferase (adenine-specific)
MSKIKFFNEDCFNTMKTMNKYNFKVDIILTSPPYNTNKKANGGKTLINTKVKDQQYNYCRYDNFCDDKTSEEYINWNINLFNYFNTILNKNGVVLYNLSYGSENTTDCFLSVSNIIKNTNFTLADCIIWKKKTALPNCCSPNKLTRITEFIFVFVKKEDFMTFNCNKKIKSYRNNGQIMYENIYNFIEAKNNDGSCNLNKATFSTDLVKQLLTIYAKPDSKIYDPFMGTGTTAIGCEELGFDCYGSEISKNQVDFSVNRLDKFRNNN